MTCAYTDGISSVLNNLKPDVSFSIGFDWNFAFMPYGDEWKGMPPRTHLLAETATLNRDPKERRKIFAQAFGIHKAGQYRPPLLQHVRNFLLLLLEDPDHFLDHLRL